ncbi:glycosyltransferase family 4 protein [Adhaeribacter radiodurans]|uniref:Glycosyltransferase family 4 protein n=1 Tax=Adhaeribacter radiodurans TaxID=2745197 RepID=A0A7L7L891_9BACT|nr:glycosyltransferase family 4 protein [Adhaeribacter radiodurans]QMU28973.1 glycosyltransferase family 4 protein [Adhaeribacter radiodurans]
MANQQNPSSGNVLFFSYYWPPSGGAGVQRCLKFVKHLPEFNLTPTVITVDDKKGAYPVLDYSLAADVPASVRVIRTNTSEPFEYYKKLTGKKEIPYGGFANQNNQNLIQKIFNFIRGNLFIPDARVGWNRYAVSAGRKLLQTEPIKAIITTSPPHSSQLIGLKLKKEFPHVKWIADMRDPWTDIYYYKELNHTTLAKQIDARYEKAVIEGADAILVTSADTKRLLAAKSAQIDSTKIKVLPNGYDEEDFTFPSEPPKDKLCITYTGTISETYNIELFLKALAEVTRRYPEVPFRLRFVGKISEMVLRQVEQAGITSISEIIPFVPHHESIRYLLSATVLLMGIPDVVNNFCILPGKLFEYLASNKPIICIGPINSDADRIIDECGAGRVFHYAAFDQMVDYLDQLTRSWKINPNLDLPIVDYHRYSRRALTGQLAEIIQGK